jgi:hypothetical protein
MYTVIDTINRRGMWIDRFPDRMAKGEGLLVILDPAQINERPDIPHNSVTILRPDNSRIDLIVAEIEVRHNVVALLFRDVLPEDIPRLSIVSWA